jgi:hypothetical protein
VLRTVGASVVGYDATKGRLLRMATADGSRTRLATPPGTLIDLAINPGDPRQYFAAADTGLYESRDAGRRWSRVDGRRAGLLAYVGPDRLILVRGDGIVERRTQSDRWEAVGNVAGAPGALAAHDGRLLLAVQDGPVLESSDGGRSWLPRVETGG